MSNIQKEMNKDLQECPIWIINNSILALKTILDVNQIKQIRGFYNNNPETWWALHHF